MGKRTIFFNRRASCDCRWAVRGSALTSHAGSGSLLEARRPLPPFSSKAHAVRDSCVDACEPASTADYHLTRSTPQMEFLRSPRRGNPDRLDPPLPRAVKSPRERESTVCRASYVLPRFGMCSLHTAELRFFAFPTAQKSSSFLSFFFKDSATMMKLIVHHLCSGGYRISLRACSLSSGQSGHHGNTVLTFGSPSHIAH